MLFGLFVGPITRWSDMPDASYSQPAACDVKVHDFDVLAKALAMLLAKCNDNLLGGALYDAVVLHHRITSALKLRHDVQIPLELLRRVARSIEPFADRSLLDAIRRCIEDLEAES